MARFGAVRRSLGIAFLAVTVPTGALAAHQTRATHATLHVTSQFKNNSAFKHVMASAKLRYTQHDVFVTVETDGLPKPSALGGAAYVVFVTDGHMSERLGALKVSGNMAGVKGQVMMFKIQDIYVYAAKSATNKRPSGKEVLAGMVG